MAANESLYSGKFETYSNNPKKRIIPFVPDHTDLLETGCGARATMKWLRSVRLVHYAVGIELFYEAAELAATTSIHLLTAGNDHPHRKPSAAALSAAPKRKPRKSPPASSDDPAHT